MTPRALELMTDGGGSRDGEGAAACIVIDRTARVKLKFAAFLGPCTGNEAEVLAGILGLLVISVYRSAHAPQRAPADSGSFPIPTVPADDTTIHWFTDSQYLVRMCGRITSGSEKLDRTTLPNFSLWRLWRPLAGAFVLRPEWIRAHAGHRENEACDRACRWLQRRGRTLLSEHGEGPIGQQAKRERGESWILIDMESILREAGSSFPAQQADDAVRPRPKDPAETFLRPVLRAITTEMVRLEQMREGAAGNVDTE